MIRKEPERGAGRRPLLTFFMGNNRQMLNEIRDSLSHLRKSQLEGNGELASGLPLKTDLSASSTNISDKHNNLSVASSSAGAKMTRLEQYHHKTLAEIRDSLRPFQTGNRPQAVGEVEISRQKIRQVMDLGVDEDIAVRALKLCNNSVEDAFALLCHIIEGHNGSSKINSVGLSGYPVNRRPSFESKYGPSSPSASDTNSVRSDSPSLSSVSPATRQPLLNGHQTPPPLPPRAPINPTSSVRGHTPPPNMQAGGEGTNGSQQVADVPPGHVQQLIQRLSPGHTTVPAVIRSHLLHQPVQPTSSPSAARGVSPVTGLAGRPTLISATQAGPQSTVTAVGQGLILNQHPNPTSSPGSGSSSSSSTTAPSGPRVTINFSHPPPPYSQASVRGPTSTMVHIQGVGMGEHSHLLGPHMTEYLSLSSSDSPLNLSTASSSAASGLSDNNGGIANGNAQVLSKVGPALPVVAARRPMSSNNAPIIMQSVKSKEVHKPVPQTATAPPPPSLASAVVPGSLASPHNYISQVQAQVNVSCGGGGGQVLSSAPTPLMAATTTTTHTRNLQIQITRHAPQTHAHIYGHTHSALPYTNEPLVPTSGTQGRPTIQIHIPGSSGVAGSAGLGYTQNHVHIHNLAGVNYDFYHRTPSDTVSTSRSDSPVSRTMNQSPLSVVSTASSPSTNSDIPDKPPPPYPVGPQGVQGQPPLPPRVPLQNKPPPPPPPSQHGVTLHLPARHCPSSSPSPPSQVPNTSLAQTMLFSQQTLVGGGQNGQSTNSVETKSEQGGDTDTETVPSSEVAGPEKTRCMSPMPQRKPEAYERDKLRRDTKVRNYSPQAFKFFMEQHVENVLKIHQQRLRRRLQLENEMAKVQLSEEAARQMRRMLHQKESNYIRLKRAKMDKSMFQKITTLGVGAFGEVALVRKHDTGTLYAMKILGKSDVLKRNQVAHVKAERDILAEADNEWVVKLYYSFQDQNNLYFVMDYVPGGDLMGLLIRLEILEEPLARFYLAELIQAIDSVHRMGFIHRDIKPDNILIDRDGHIKLTDFGLCTGFRWTHNSKYYQRDGTHARQDSMEVKCQLDEQCQCEILKPLERRRKREERAHSLVGTPNYIAPEVLMRSSGYTSVCDWWSVGVILYEMLVGHPPFYASSPAETQYKVINWKETLKLPPESNLSQSAKDLILRLCCGPEERLGLKGAGEIKAHPFFLGIHFEGLRRQPPPYIPHIRYATDTSNFDPVDPDKLRNSDSEENKRADKLENGKHPEHAFFEFTFRRFFDDGGHPCAPSLEDPESNSPVYV